MKPSGFLPAGMAGSLPHVSKPLLREHHHLLSLPGSAVTPQRRLLISCGQGGVFYPRSPHKLNQSASSRGRKSPRSRLACPPRCASSAVEAGPPGGGGAAATLHWPPWQPPPPALALQSPTRDPGRLLAFRPPLSALGGGAGRFRGGSPWLTTAQRRRPGGAPLWETPPPAPYPCNNYSSQ